MTREAKVMAFSIGCFLMAWLLFTAVAVFGQERPSEPQPGDDGYLIAPIPDSFSGIWRVTLDGNDRAIRNGDVLLTRNSEAVGNQTPGDRNHVGIYRNGRVIEAQEGLGVVSCCLGDFVKGYPDIECVVLFADKNKAEEFSAAAAALVGRPYKRLAGSGKHGLNCVTVAKLAAEHVTGTSLAWRRPDHVRQCAKCQRWKKYDPCGRQDVCGHLSSCTADPSVVLGACR